MMHLLKITVMIIRMPVCPQLAKYFFWGGGITYTKILYLSQRDRSSCV